MMDEIPEIECEECGWQGYRSELLCNPEDENKSVEEARFNVCPNCHAIDSFIDYED